MQWTNESGELRYLYAHVALHESDEGLIPDLAWSFGEI